MTKEQVFPKKNNIIIIKKLLFKIHSFFYTYHNHFLKKYICILQKQKMGEYFQSSTFRKYNVLNVLSFIQVNLAMSSHAAFLCLFVFWCRGMVAYAGVVCTTDAYCQSQSPLSSCKDGFCTNPYSSGCFPGAKRVCNSLDTKGSSERGECVPNELKYPEVRLFPSLWSKINFIPSEKAFKPGMFAISSGKGSVMRWPGITFAPGLTGKT